MEHWFFFFLSSLNFWWHFQVSLFHASSSLFFYPPCLKLSVITSHNSLNIQGTALWWGLGRSRLFIKGNKECEIVSECLFVLFFCFFLSEPCTWWPVPDDQEPSWVSQHPRRAGDRVQKWFVFLQHVSPVNSFCQSTFVLCFLCSELTLFICFTTQIMITINWLIENSDKFNFFFLLNISSEFVSAIHNS